MGREHSTSYNRNSLTAGALLIIAFIFGGGGSGAGLANLLVQVVALLILALHRRLFVDFFSQAPRHVAVLVAITILLPLLQCIPLPPSLWHHLPGRELAEQSLALLGRQNNWMPISLNVRRTIIAFMALMPPLVIILLVFRSTKLEQRMLLAVIVGCGIIQVLLGAQQLALGNKRWMFYGEAIGTLDLQGTFANHNSTGLFFCVTLCALAGVIINRPATFARLGIALGVAGLICVGLFLTRSRSSIVLGVIPLAIPLYYFKEWWAYFITSKWRFAALSAVATILIVIVSLIVGSARVQSSFSRFGHLEDARPAIWEDAQISARRFWPVGSGIGTFDEVFQIDETLENIGPGRAGRAHNDYLEFVIEAGLFGIIILSGWIIAIIFAIWSGLSACRERGTAMAASGVLVLIACQSLLDYPLRNQTFLCVGGLMLTFLWSKGSGRVRRHALEG